LFVIPATPRTPVEAYDSLYERLGNAMGAAGPVHRILLSLLMQLVSMLRAIALKAPSATPPVAQLPAEVAPREAAAPVAPPIGHSSCPSIRIPRARLAVAVGPRRRMPQAEPASAQPGQEPIGAWPASDHAIPFHTPPLYAPMVSFASPIRKNPSGHDAHAHVHIVAISKRSTAPAAPEIRARRVVIARGGAST
jgi:hypothetical protein